MTSTNRHEPHVYSFHGRPTQVACPIGYEAHCVVTRDAFELTVFRSHPLRPRSLEAPPTTPPILLIPGLGSNRFTFGLHRRHGLAPVLNTLGRDVWLAELRGSRTSRFLGAGRPRIDIDAKLGSDLPALVDYIRKTTGAATVDLVGHSLGGLLSLLYAGGPDADHVGRVATVATPGHFKGLGGLIESAPMYGALSKGIEHFIGGVERLGVSALARLGGPLPHFGAMSRHFLPGACDAATRRRYLDHAVEDIHGSELAQLVRWVREGEIMDRDGRSFEPRLADVDASVLVIAATRDKIVTEAAALAAYTKVGSADKRLMRVSRANGASRDYAHADLLLAPSAKTDVLEPLADWLEGRTCGQPSNGAPVVTAASTPWNLRRKLEGSGSAR
jgi:pimeloyl-ACP methyl ester carboxylesterase